MSNSKEDEELRLLFQINIEDLRYCKKQQWYTLYITLLAIGGLITLAVALKPFSACLKEFLLIICSWIVSFIGIAFMIVYYSSIKTFRDLKLKIIGEFSKKAAEISDISAEDNRCANRRDRDITIAFSFITFIAAVLATWVILIPPK